MWAKLVTTDNKDVRINVNNVIYIRDDGDTTLVYLIGSSQGEPLFLRVRDKIDDVELALKNAS